MKSKTVVDSTDPIKQADSETELNAAKVAAYDCLANLQYWQARLSELNAKIMQLTQQASQYDSGRQLSNVDINQHRSMLKEG